MEERDALAWLGRKIGWGFHAGQWETWQSLGVDAVIDRLVDGDANGVEAIADPFAGLTDDPDNLGAAVRSGVARWIGYAAATPRPLVTFMEFFWSDYFAVSIRSVRPPTLMFEHMNLLRRHALGNFGELLRDVTIDGAMLRFLDGATNTAASPNENYGRELLELYSVGVGNFTEADVKAAAKALTGWVVRRIDPTPRFMSFRHDPTPQTLLGVSGVSDVDSTIDAILAHPATAPRVVDKIATAVLGPGHDAAAVQPLVAAFGSDWELRPVVRGLLELAVSGAAKPAIVEPFPWFIAAQRATQSRPQQGALREYFRAAAQVPLLPPNVGGFPGPDAYLSTSATIARFNFASHLAERASRSSTAMEASADVEGLAFQLGLVDGFAPTTRDAIDRLPAGVQRVAAALASPDLVVV